MALRLIIGRFCCESSCYEMLSWGQNISVFHMITCIWSQPIRMVQRAICWFWPPLLITCGGSPGSFFLQKALSRDIFSILIILPPAGDCYTSSTLKSKSKNISWKFKGLKSLNHLSWNQMWKGGLAGALGAESAWNKKVSEMLRRPRGLQLKKNVVLTLMSLE